MEDEMANMIELMELGAEPFKPCAVYIKGIDSILVITKDVSYSLAYTDNGFVSIMQRNHDVDEFVGFEVDFAVEFCEKNSLIRDGKISVKDLCSIVGTIVKSQHRAEIENIAREVQAHCEFVKEFPQ